MLMDLEGLVNKYDMKVNGILHVGAHLAEESSEYARLFGAESVWWVEANPDVFQKIEAVLSQYPTQRLIPGLVYSVPDLDKEFNVTNYDGMSSSIFEFGTHPTFSPDTVFVDKIRLTTTTIDRIVRTHGIVANFLNMDLQGAEGHALLGAREYLPSVDYIMTEINKKEVYQGCAKVWQLQEFLDPFGFDLVETFWVHDQGWGDGLFVRRNDG